MFMHYNSTLEHPFQAMPPPAGETPAWLAICLVKSLKDWLGQSCRLSWSPGQPELQLGYEVQSVPTREFARAFAPLLCPIQSVWPLQIFATADNRELICLSFAQTDQGYLLRQKNISGLWCDTLQDVYLLLRFPDASAAACMYRLLEAVVQGREVVPLEWSDEAFLTRQRLCTPDSTLSYCYVSFTASAAQQNPTACLAGLQLSQKEHLWRLFLEKHLIPPEFEWVRAAQLRDGVPNWIEWHLALYRTLEQLGFRFQSSGNQFELTDSTGKRLYFSVDHPNAAEHVLMKILFPLTPSILLPGS